MQVELYYERNRKISVLATLALLFVVKCTQRRITQPLSFCGIKCHLWIHFDTLNYHLIKKYSKEEMIDMLSIYVEVWISATDADRKVSRDTFDNRLMIFN